MTFFLGLLAGFGPMVIFLYQSVMSELAKTIDISLNLITISISIFLMGVAIGQLVSGPLSDMYGRTRLIRAGLILFIISTCIDLYVQRIEVTQWIRFVQAISTGMVTIQVRALIAESYEHKTATILMSQTTAISAGARFLAPIAGIAIVSLLGLVALDWLVLIIAITYLTLIHSIPLEKTRSKNQQQSKNLLDTFDLIKQAVGLSETRYFLVIGVLVSACYFSIISSSVLYLSGIMQVDKTLLTIFLSLLSITVLGASLLNATLVTRFQQKAILHGSAALCLFITITLWIANNYISAKYQMFCLLVIVATSFIIRLNAMTWAIKSCDDAKATVTSLFHTLAIAIGSLAGFYINQTLFLNTNILFICLTGFSFLTFVLIIKNSIPGIGTNIKIRSTN